VNEKDNDEIRLQGKQFNSPGLIGQLPFLQSINIRRVALRVRDGESKRMPGASLNSPISAT
jgi:hypothetical protein